VKPTVVIVGRPNVGKSTLFNRITRTRRAIVTPTAGTTRDSIALPLTWRNAHFALVDTGGLFGASEDPLHDLVVQQGNRALGQADVVVIVFDGDQGLVSGDLEVVRQVRATGLPVIAAVNKTDVRGAREAAVQFFRDQGEVYKAEIISAIPLMVGFLLAGFTHRKQALHDMVASTVVVRESPGHVVAALAITLVGVAAPFVVMFMFGAALLMAFMGGMAGGMLGDMAMQGAKPPATQMAKPAPRKPAPPAPPTPFTCSVALAPATAPMSLPIITYLLVPLPLERRNLD